MGLHSLLLTKDAALLEMIRTNFARFSIEVEMRSDASSAIELLIRRHFDCFVVDCDDVPRSSEVVAKIRASGANKQSVICSVVNAVTTVSSAFEQGANFVLGKPVSEKLLHGFIDTAMPRMEREHRRYFRHLVDVPIELTCPSGDAFSGKIMNVSEGGLALTRFGPAEVQGVVIVKFKLPNLEQQTFQAKAEVVWKDAFAMGIRFLRVESACQSGFDGWLESLESQMRLRESILVPAKS
jgi:CheY-like chemotaxis protein